MKQDSTPNSKQCQKNTTDGQWQQLIREIGKTLFSLKARSVQILALADFHEGVGHCRCFRKPADFWFFRTIPTTRYAHDEKWIQNDGKLTLIASEKTTGTAAILQNFYSSNCMVKKGSCLLWVLVFAIECFGNDTLARCVGSAFAFRGKSHADHEKNRIGSNGSIRPLRKIFSCKDSTKRYVHRRTGRYTRRIRHLHDPTSVTARNEEENSEHCGFGDFKSGEETKYWRKWGLW